MKLNMILQLLEAHNKDYPGDVDDDAQDTEWEKMFQFMQQNVPQQALDRIPAMGKDFKRHIDQRRKMNPNRKHVGAGAFSYVDKDSSPHEMDRVTRTHSERDGGYIWYNLISKTPDLQNNPYVPRVYAKRDGQYVEFDVEQLQSLKVLDDNNEMLQAMLKRITGVDMSISHGRMSVDKFADMIAAIIRKRGAGWDNLDPDFANIIRVLTQITSNSEELMFDLHAGNMMVRLTGRGMPQLVIVDPLAVLKT